MFLDKYHQKLADYETKAKESIKKSTKSTFILILLIIVIQE